MDYSSVAHIGIFTTQSFLDATLCLQLMREIVLCGERLVILLGQMMGAIWKSGDCDGGFGIIHGSSSDLVAAGGMSPSG